VTVSDKDIEMYEAGKAFVRLGLKLKNGVDTGLDPETLAFMITVSKSIPEPSEKTGPPKWSEEKDPVGALILKWIKNGDPVPTGQSKDIRNALTRLRRNGFIENIGTRKDPMWSLTTDATKAKVVVDLKVRRQQQAAAQAKHILLKGESS
jgi:hypothetical protein